MADLSRPDTSLAELIFRAREREEEKRPGEKEIRGLGVNASDLGRDCSRQKWYDLRWASVPEKLSGRTLRIFERGLMEEKRVVADLKRIGCLVSGYDRDQTSFSLADGWLRGRPDGLVLGLPGDEETWHVLEIKTLKAADWRAVAKHGLSAAKPEHWHQLHIGIAGAGHRKGLYVGVNKDTEEILTEILDLDEDLVEIQVRNVLSLLSGPPDQRLSPDSSACRWCRHRKVCHEDGEPRVTCRTCVHFRFGEYGWGFCGLDDDGKDGALREEPRSPKEQFDACPSWTLSEFMEEEDR